MISIKIGNLEAIIYHLNQGKDNAGLGRQALAEFLKGVKGELEKVQALKDADVCENCQNDPEVDVCVDCGRRRDESDSKEEKC